MSVSGEPGPRSGAKRLFDELSGLSAALRAERIAKLCAERPELAQELRELERAHPAGGPSPASAPGGTPSGAPSIAGFELRARLGGGGMGEVWEASDHRLGRRVALKLLPAGCLDSAVARERFRREALAAARLNHPGIVAVFAAGEDGDRPWISQELVAGGRTLRDRIEELRRAIEVPAGHERAVAELFARIAEALEAAHRAGVVHRDLKPQNILLTEGGAPKVADFGLARLQGEAALSITGEFLGTWLYASPEHFGTRGQPIDAQSDVFCLGIALYECLTLERPFRGEMSHEVAQAIIELDPPEPRRLRSRVPRDLSVICMRALEKRRAQRYASMQALADDLGRFLADEPIHARPPGPVERVRRWGRRHPGAATGLALGAAALVGLSFSQWRTLQALEATRLARRGESRANAELQATVGELRASRDEARADRAVSDEVLLVLSDLFDAASPFRLGRGEPTVRELVSAGAEQLRAGEPESPRARARLLTTLGGVLASLGDTPQAEELLSEALALWRGLDLEGSPDGLETRWTLANTRMNLGDHAGALELTLPLVEAWRRGELPAEQASRVLADLGRLECAAGDLDGARATFEESLALCEASFGRSSCEAAYVRSGMAEVDYRQGCFAEGLALVEGDFELLRPLLAAGNSFALDACNTRALFLQALGRLGEAEALLAEALGVAERVLGPDHARSLNLRTNLGTVLQDLGRLEQAEVLFRTSHDLSGAHLGRGAHETLVAKNNLAHCLLLMDRLDEGEELLRELVDDAEHSRGSDHLVTAQARISLGVCLWRQGKAAEAVTLIESALPAIPEGNALREQVLQALVHYRRDAEAQRRAEAASR